MWAGNGWLAALLSASTLFAACGTSEEGLAGTQLPLTPDANVLLCVVDTLRADRLGPWGGDERTSPNVARLADEGVLFSDCRAPSPWTLPSMGTLFTGLYPRSHGAGLHGLERDVRKQEPRGLAPGIQTVGVLFRERGYGTYLKATNAFLAFGLEAGFDQFAIDPAQKTHAEEVVDWAVKRLRKHDPEKPLFMVLHFIDVHTPNRVGQGVGEEDLAAFDDQELPRVRGLHRTWQALAELGEAHDEFLAQRRRVYDASMRYVDRQLGRLRAELEELDLGPTYVVFTSDHGEDFLDHLDTDRASGHVDPRGHRGAGHGHNLHQALTHVPLVISGPGLPRGRRVGTRVGLVDLLPTLSELVGIRRPAGLQGRSLLPDLLGVEMPARAFLAENIAYGNERVAFFSPDDWLLIQPQHASERPQLFDLARDFDEQDDLSEARSDKLRELTEALQALELRLERRDGNELEVPAELTRSLQGLGYLGESR